jgi:hypothetical protein
MATRKPVLRVWCLPALPEDKYVALHKDLVAAAVSIKGLELKKEEDIITLFPADLMKHGLGAEILVEYDDIADYWERREELQQLASKLGNVVKKHFPKAYVQCETRSGDGKTRMHWTSRQATTRKEVDKIRKAAEKLLPEFITKASKECYCEANAMDHKGACGHHNVLGAYRWAVEEGAKILAIEDDEDFQTEADVYVERCRDDGIYNDLHVKLKGAEQPAAA